MTKTVQATVVGGRVHGVGYRAWCEGEARRRGLRGWVRNCSSGDVEALFAGEDAAVDAMIEALWKGPPSALVASVETNASDDIPSSFEVRPTV